MSVLLKSLSPAKDAVAVTISATALIQELWESRVWVNPRVFLKAAQAELACLAVQGLGEEDSVQSHEMQWAWYGDDLRSLYADSLFQGAIRSSYSWRGETSEEISELHGTFQLRKSENNFESSGIVDSHGDIVQDVQDVLLKSEQKDCAIAVSVRWAVDDAHDAVKIKITVAHAYLLHVLPPPLESQRDDLLAHWHLFLRDLSSPAEWVLHEDPHQAVKEMTQFLFASPNGTEIFKKKLIHFCNCTEEKVLKLMNILPPEELKELDQVFEVSCKYCAKTYRVDKSKSGLA